MTERQSLLRGKGPRGPARAAFEQAAAAVHSMDSVLRGKDAVHCESADAASALRQSPRGVWAKGEVAEMTTCAVAAAVASGGVQLGTAERSSLREALSLCYEIAGVASA